MAKSLRWLKLPVSSRCCQSFRVRAVVAPVAVLGLLLGLGAVGCRSTSPVPTPDAQGQISVEEQDAEAALLPPAAPPPPPDNAYLAQLPPPVTGPLAELPIKVVVPSYLPAGMVLTNYGIDQESANAPAYWLIYGDDRDRCFAIESTPGGIGGAELTNQQPLELPLFGSGYSLHYGAGAGGQVELFTDWLSGPDSFYRLVGAGLVEQRYGLSCVSISPEEAKQIAESLIYFSADITTLD